MNKTYTIDELRKLQPIDNTARITAEKQLASLTYEKEQAEKEYQEAISRNDLATASQAKAREITTADLISEKEKELFSVREAEEMIYSRETVKESWNKYAAGINTAFKAKFEKYLEIRKEMAKIFLELAESQRQAINDIVHVNALYESMETPTTVLPGCSSDLVKPALLDSYPEQKIKKMTYQEVMGCSNVAAGIIKVPYTEDYIIKALIASGEIDTRKEQDLVSVVDLLQPTHSTIN